jgi:hypothetical protein
MHATLGFEIEMPSVVVPVTSMHVRPPAKGYVELAHAPLTGPKPGHAGSATVAPSLGTLTVTHGSAMVQPLAFEITRPQTVYVPAHFAVNVPPVPSGPPHPVFGIGDARPDEISITYGGDDPAEQYQTLFM